MFLLQRSVLEQQRLGKFGRTGLQSLFEEISSSFNLASTLLRETRLLASGWHSQRPHSTIAKLDFQLARILTYRLTNLLKYTFQISKAMG